MDLIYKILYFVLTLLLLVTFIFILVKIYNYISTYINKCYLPEKNFNGMFPKAKLVHTNIQTLQQIQPEVDFEKISLQFKPEKVVKNISRSKGKLVGNDIELAFVNDLKDNNFRVYNLANKEEINLSKILYSYEPEYGSENKFYVII